MFLCVSLKEMTCISKDQPPPVDFPLCFPKGNVLNFKKSPPPADFLCVPLRQMTYISTNSCVRRISFVFAEGELPAFEYVFAVRTEKKQLPALIN